MAKYTFPTDAEIDAAVSDQLPLNAPFMMFDDLLSDLFDEKNPDFLADWDAYDASPPAREDWVARQWSRWTGNA